VVYVVTIITVVWFEIHAGPLLRLEPRWNNWKWRRLIIGLVDGIYLNATETLSSAAAFVGRWIRSLYWWW
jgi:hypothetical protein